jgi:hypothetical protein
MGESTMTIITTNWQSKVTPLDAYVQGEQKPIPWLFGSNAPVSIDFTNTLEEGEVIVSPIATLLRMPASGETDYTEFPEGLEGGPVISGVFVSHILQDLERGYVYRLEVLIGADNNRRGASELVQCF